MSVRSFESAPFLLHVSNYANPAMQAGTDEDAMDGGADCPPNEIPSVLGCLRGFGSAVALEAVTGLLLFSLWHFRHIAW
jgi:hypothetical protein